MPSSGQCQPSAGTPVPQCQPVPAFGWHCSAPVLQCLTVLTVIGHNSGLMRVIMWVEIHLMSSKHGETALERVPE